MKLDKTDGSALQSSDYNSNYIANKAVDNIYNQNINQGAACSHTLLGEDNWWQFTFDYDILLYQVKIWTLYTYEPERLEDAEVQVSNEAAESYELCGKVGDVTETSDPVYVTCSTLLRGRKIRINILSNPVIICEIDFYGVQDF